MNIVWTIIIGFVVGLIARAIMPGKEVAGCIITTLLGIGGAIIGKFLGQGLGYYHEGQSAGFFMSVLGAMILLFIFHLLRKNNTAP